MFLTKNEVKIIEFIKRFALSLSFKTVPRIAGGWVRDKLLGINSDDIDIAIQNISGYKFAELLLEWGNLNKNIHKISANPEKSKHLETAVVHLFGRDVDFVILRTEVYSDTRIPEIRPGTAEEDSLRRDMTINSLFYNIITGCIEDFTGKGLLDLKNGILRTPLSPKQTFLDDPLRILRFFRFHAKFKFFLVSEVCDAIQQNEIQNAFTTKISAERIWKEIYKMFLYPEGTLGLLKLVSLNFIFPIFKFNYQNLCGKSNIFYKKTKRFYHLLENRDYLVLVKIFTIFHVLDAEKCQFIFKEILKAPGFFIKSSTLIYKNFSKIDLIFDERKCIILRNLIFYMLEAKELWKVCFIIYFGINDGFEMEMILKEITVLELERKCFYKKFKVNGTNLKPFLDKQISSMGFYLKVCKMLEVENENLNAEEIIKMALKEYSISK